MARLFWSGRSEQAPLPTNFEYAGPPYDPMLEQGTIKRLHPEPIGPTPPAILQTRGGSYAFLSARLRLAFGWFVGFFLRLSRLCEQFIPFCPR